MLWLLLVVLVIVLLVALVGAIGYRWRGGAGAGAAPQTTIVESGRSAETTPRTRTRTVTRSTEIVDDR